ncbi:MAG: ATP-binding protein, partial [Pseudomonadota bacterium]
LLLLPCITAAWFTEKYFTDHRYHVAIYGVLLVVVGFVFPKIKVQAEHSLENILFKGMFDYRKILDSLSRQMIRIQNLDQLVSYATDTIAKAVDTSSLFVYLLNNNGEYALSASYGKTSGAAHNINAQNSLIQHMAATDEIIIKGRNINNKNSPAIPDASSELTNLGASLAIPIKYENELKGFMLLGEKQSAGDYSKDELTVLSTTANQLSVAIENSKRYDEIQGLNIGLEQKVSERTEQLKKANEELKELDTLKSEFFAKVSHELRTPLSNIILPIQSIIDRLGNQITPENLYEKQAMLRNAQKLLKRINEILDVAKLDSGKMPLKTQLRDINNILEDIVVASSIGAKEMEVNLVFHPKDDLSRIYVDTDKIEKALANLIGNALKFTEGKDKRAVTVTTRETETHVEVIVTDTGIGIPKGQIPYIFDRFHQADGSSSRKFEGTGLGLCIAKEFIELHHGAIEVESEVDKGTLFAVRLLKGAAHLALAEIMPEPKFETVDEFENRRGSDRRKDDRRENDRRLMSKEDRETINLIQVQLSDLVQGRKVVIDQTQAKDAPVVLIVEDNRDLASNIARCLVPFYNVCVAGNGRQAIDHMLKKAPDLIISDVMMPEMDGAELCQRVRQAEETRHIPFIMLTARASTEDKIAGLKLGADHYLAKPFNPKELLAVVESLLANKGLQAELGRKNSELNLALHKLEEAQVQLVHTARLESVGQLAAGIAHEIKNNIYCVRAGMDGINKRLTMISEGKLNIADTCESLKDAIVTNNKAVDNTLYIVNSLLDFSRKNKEGLAFSNINKGIETTLAIVMPRIKDKITVELELGELAPVECKIEEINQVIMNMLINSHQAISGKGIVWIKTFQDNDFAVISIKDNGSGIPQENLDKIFAPFFSTKEKELNTGLGLSICHNIIHAHHGTIKVNSETGKGTEFVISLPVRQPFNCRV